MTVTINEKDYQQFSQYLEKECGIVLGSSKQYLVKSRLSKLIEKNNVDSISALIGQILSGRDHKLKKEAIDAMTTNETLWFRDVYPFEVFKNQLLPEVTKEHKTVKIWSAASSSGQEPYSLAMSILEAKKEGLPSSVSASIVATDISDTMLERCKLGVYDELALRRGLSEERKRHFFTKHSESCMQVNNQVKSLVTFKKQNLLDSYLSLGKFDIIFCRNVLIYFSVEMKRQVLINMSQCLNPGGYLVLGASESMTELSDYFDMVRCNPGIIYRRKP
ncbi:protein-glutamate O-methyltransferase CheR [Vibrio sp.]|nr:protein-glutamate O-methyltransferase CheR [Vibrio sp.]